MFTWVTWFICHKSYVIYVKCSCWSLGHTEQLLFSRVSSKVMVCHAVTCHMSNVKWLGWSSGHAEQLLFSCLGSKVTVYRWKWHCLFLAIVGLAYKPEVITPKNVYYSFGWFWAPPSYRGLKIIANFAYNQWHFSLDMKTKVVQHVQRLSLIHIWRCRRRLRCRSRWSPYH